MAYFPDGIYTFFSTGPKGSRVPSGEVAILNDEIGYLDDHDKQMLSDQFPEGPISPRTKTELEKYLHDQTGHSHLEYSGDGSDVESEDETPVSGIAGEDLHEGGGDASVDQLHEGVPPQNT